MTNLPFNSPYAHGFVRAAVATPRVRVADPRHNGRRPGLCARPQQLQLSPSALRRIGTRNMIVAATPAKLARTPVLCFDTGVPGLDLELAARGYLPVIVGYRRERLVKIMV
jgi:hypothetical protein